MSQPDLHLEDIDRLVVPQLSKDFQVKIEELVVASRKRFDTPVNVYAQAERTLLSELGLLDWQTTQTAELHAQSKRSVGGGEIGRRTFSTEI